MSFFKKVSDFLRIRKNEQKRTAKRSFAAAKGGRLFDFQSGTRSADEEIRWDLRKVRDRCRELARNNDYAKRFISLMKTNVIGEMGIQLQAESRNSNGEDDDAANTIIEDQWQKWGRKGNCTTDGRLSFIDCQDLVMESLAVEGECLIQIVRNYNNAWGFALKFLDNDMLDEELNETLSNGNSIRMGVELNQDDRVVAYWLWNYNPNDYLVQNPRREHRRIPASDILHLFKAQRPGQNRGIPPMATAVLDLKQLDGYIESELVAARVASAKMGFFRSQKGEEYKGEATEDEYTPLMSAEPGTFEQLPDGMEFQQFDPQHPTSQFKDFIKQVLRSVASGTNVSYASLSNDLESVNYSSIRQGALEERHHFKKEQRYIIEHFLQPVFEAWLLFSMTKNVVSLPVHKFEKFSSPKWMPRGFGYIDPLKEVQSYILALDNGFMTLQDIASIHGRDVKTLFEMIQKEKELAKKYGITLTVDSKKDKTQKLMEEEKEDG